MPPPVEVTRWSGRALFRIGAGEQLSAIAADLTGALAARPTPDGP